MSVTLNNCGFNQLDFFQLLAGAIVQDESGNVRLRVALHEEECSAVTPLLDCTTAQQEPLELLKQIFSVDSCDRIVLNLSLDTIS